MALDQAFLSEPAEPLEAVYVLRVTSQQLAAVLQLLDKLVGGGGPNGFYYYLHFPCPLTEAAAVVFFEEVQLEELLGSL